MKVSASLPYNIRVLNVAHPSASVEQKCMTIDRQGLIWLGTNSGVKSYDGYRFNTYRSDAQSPNILPNNQVLSMTEDHANCLWIGTKNGLVRMEKETGRFTTFHSKDKNKREIYALFTSKDGTVWIGTDDGITTYSHKTGRFYDYTSKNTQVEPNGKKIPLDYLNAKSFVEDKNGDIYIGTWSANYYRIDRKRHLIYRYDTSKCSNISLTYMLMLDPMGRLWISTWGGGIKCATNPRNQKDQGIIDFYDGNTEHGINYRMAYDPMTRSIWACSRYGIAVADADNISKGFTYYKELNDTENHQLENVTDICTDNKGNIWVQTVNNGIYHISTIPAMFTLLHVLPELSLSNRIRTIFPAGNNRFWLALAPAGIALYDNATGNTITNSQIPELANVPFDAITTHISSIATNNGETWMANNGHGIIILKNGKATMKNSGNCQFVKDNFVKSLLRTRRGVMFVGERHHLSYRLPSGRCHTFAEDIDVCGMTEDHKGNIWVATENKGIICISGNLNNPKTLKMRFFNSENGNLAVNDAINCMEDSRHRLWAISNSGGLFLLEGGKFNCLSDELHWDMDRIFSIAEDNNHRLWLTTDNAIICLVYNGKDNTRYAVFTKENGLGNIIFMANSCLKAGNKIYFGSGRNLIEVNTNITVNNKFMPTAKNMIVTDLIIDGRHYSELDSTMRHKLSEYTPQYMKEITIPASVSKFSVEFALLSYVNTADCKYGYFLEGYDKEWHYVDADIRQASFENIPSGKYKLHLKAVDSFGRWAEMPYTISINVLPPWYASVWAYLAYFLIIIAGIRFAISWYKERLQTKNKLQMQVVFTNITHELLTPLTVISASADSIEHEHPDVASHTSLIHNNIQRLTRMLRQILEVRKAQAGELKLSVGQGLIGDFCKDTCQSIIPIFAQKEIQFSQDITCLGQTAWFDSDKIEKILYNLLSNAVKYSNLGGKIHVAVGIENNMATITVADTGIGISKDKMKHLYNRFLDGDYRKMNVMGTGIGLSLVNDLVKLHHGKISCSSKEGEGTTFRISIPIDRESYEESEMASDNKTLTTAPANNTATESMADAMDEIPRSNSDASDPDKGNNDDGKEKDHTILLVEDNTELLQIMGNLLSRHFNVKKATDGEKAIKIIQKTALDVVVTDVMMPVMDGIELTKWIKGNDDYSQLPVIMLTAKTQDADRNEAYRTGADEYITKPFVLNDLLIRIENIIKNRELVRKKFEQQTDFNVEEQHYSSPDKLFIESVIAKIMDNITDSDYGREELAADLCISSSSLYNKLRAITGQNITGFITSIRLKEACRILRMEPTIRVNELSYKVGFSTPRYFSQCFKKEFGMLVKEYVEKNISDKDSADRNISEENISENKENTEKGEE